MSISLFNTVPAGAIETILDSTNKPLFKRADLGRFLGIIDIRHNFKNIPTKSRSELGEFPTTSRSGMNGGGKNPHDAFVNLDASLEIVVRSRKPKAVELVKWLTRKGVEKIAEDRLAAQQEQHQKAIAEKQRSIDEKDMQIALLDDDLLDSEDLVRQLEYSNTELQGEIRANDNQIAYLQQQHVPLLEDDNKNYGMTIIAKNDESAEYPFISICGQHGYRRQKKRVVLLKNPGSTEFVDGPTPNAIVMYNLWREHGLIETDPVKPRDFCLINVDSEQLLRIV